MNITVEFDGKTYAGVLALVEPPVDTDAVKPETPAVPDSAAPETPAQQ